MKTQAQPRALYLLNFVSMWECFSYYGMRVLLVLFMVHELHYEDGQAFGLYALYTTLVEFGGVLGGLAADRYLGLKRSIVCGGVTIALGHLCMVLPDSQLSFFLGLGLIISGTSLFRSNVAAFLSEFYEENDPRRDAGYTLYYTGINLGGFLASILCGIVGEVYGWHAGFGLAAIGMLAGNIALYMGRKMLQDKGEIAQPIQNANLVSVAGLAATALVSGVALYFYFYVMPLFPFVAAGLVYYIYRQIKGSVSTGMQGFGRLGLYLVFMVIYYGCEEQLGSSLVLFAERHVNRETLFGSIPAASLVTFNPLTILIIGPFVAYLLQKIRLDGLNKIGLSFTFLGAAFGLLYAGGMFLTISQEVSLGYAVGSIVLISIGELLIGPTVYVTASEVAPKALQGLVMGTVTLAFSLANLFSGFLSQMMAVGETDNSLEVYTSGFWLIGCGSLALALTIIMINNRQKVFA